MSHEMDALLALSRLVLAGVFGGAGIAKLVRPGAAGTAAADLGVPPRLRRPAALGLPLVEVVVAVALVAPPPWGWWGAVGALGLLVAFTTAVALAVVRGRAAGCRCFGQREPAPSGVGSLVRNQLLVGLAVLVVWQGPTGSGPPVLGWLGGLPPLRSLALAVGGVAVAAVARLIWRRPAATRSTGTRSLRSEDAGAPAGPRVVLRSHRPELTIGMATFRDFDGVYFTLQSMRLYQDLEGTELVVVDNEGCSDTQRFVEGWTGGRYVLATEQVGTAASRERVFGEARGHAVLCCDSHVLLVPGAVARLKRYYREHPDSGDLLQGPMLYDDGRSISTHFEPRWRAQMWGTWATDPRGLDEDGEPFDIPMQGLGVFSCRTDAWLGFNPRFRGFGGEEGYIHEKFRQAGRRCLCLPWLRWMHRFGRPGGVPFPLSVEDKLRNYLIGHTELGMDLTPVLDHFSEHLPPERVRQVAREAVGQGRPEELEASR